MIEVRKDQFTEARSESEKSLIDTSYSSYQKKKEEKNRKETKTDCSVCNGDTSWLVSKVSSHFW